MALFADFDETVSWFVNWLETEALPRWIDSGFDEKSGSFAERVAQDGTPCLSDSKRARVQPRQIYCMVEGGLNGFDGDWRGVSRRAMETFDRTFQREDGLYGALLSPAGELVDDSFDLYNQAFALFGMLHMARAFPDRLDEMEAKARALLDLLNAGYKHPLGGYQMSNPPSEPSCSNPHMHLFETAQEWAKVAQEKEIWSKLAAEIAELAMSRFIDVETGALREFFTAHWTPMDGDLGRVVETGHLFEWAWLLARWGKAEENKVALAKAKRLYEIACNHGVCETRKVAFMAMNDDFSPRDETARLWPQSEWMKSSALLACQSSGEEREAYLTDTLRACAALRVFLEPCKPGLWMDKLKPDGHFVDEPAPASTFYHIVCAIYELASIRETLKREQASA